MIVITTREGQVVPYPGDNYKTGTHYLHLLRGSGDDAARLGTIPHGMWTSVIIVAHEDVEHWVNTLEGRMSLPPSGMRGRWKD